MNDIVADDLVRVAQDDADACELMMSTTPPRLGMAAYHAEQCAEKAVKALTTLGIAYGWTHDVRGLAALIPATQSFSSPATHTTSEIDLNTVKLEAAIHAQSNLQPELKRRLAVHQNASPA